ncbi:MAG: hypothetical protein M3362_25300, partial [Acidobacteriota bacterium]|nr:hypothetical protein [Acidobacteriota bacterium]
MKSCPTCNRTFEDTFTFCLVDGSILSAPFDPLATRQNPEARNTYPPPTEVLPPQNFPNSRDVLPPTIASPQAEYVQPPSLNNALPYQQPSQSSKGQSASLKVPRRSRVLALVVSVIALFIIGKLADEITIARYYDHVTGPYETGIALCLLSYGVLAFFFGYKWPQGGWKWGLWLTAIPAIFIIFGSLKAQSGDKALFD